MKLTFSDGTTIGPREFRDLLIFVGIFLLVYCLMQVLLG